MDALDRDMRIRLGAIAWLEPLAQLHPDGLIPRSLLANGFGYSPELEIGKPPPTYGTAGAMSQIHLVSRRGIFKPKLCDYPLTITTTYQSSYDDHFDKEAGLLMYHYTPGKTGGALNEGLRALVALEPRRPLIYIHALERGRYLCMPAWVLEDHPEREGGMFGIALGDELRTTYATDFDPASITVEQRREIHWRQLRRPIFRQEVLTAYEHCCALCRLGHPDLLEAAHIKPHSEEGPPTVPNGIAMCHLHHRAYDSNLLGINPDRRIVISERLLNVRDGPTLTHSIQGLHHKDIRVPRAQALHPNSRWLQERWERFLGNTGS